MLSAGQPRHYSGEAATDDKVNTARSQPEGRSSARKRRLVESESEEEGSLDAERPASATPHLKHLHKRAATPLAPEQVQ